MGNCQAAEAATVVIQHPRGGRVQRLYWPVSASEVMRNNPGHYVALVTFCHTREDGAGERSGGVRFTRVKLLRPKDTLILGQVYRLVTSQEVMKGLWAKKCERMRQTQLDESKKQARRREIPDHGRVRQARPETMERMNQEGKQEAKEERHQPRPNQAAARASSKPWRPSLQSISEATI